MTRRKRSNVEESPTSSSLSEHHVRMEIDIQALRANNKDLVQSVAKLKQEKALMQKEHTALQEEFFKLNSKYVNLKNIFSTIDRTIKLAFSNMADGVNHLAKVMHLCSVGNAVSGLNKEPKILTVKPHMVNGTVIQNPTITLSRFNDSDSRESPNNTEQRQQQITSPRRQINQDFVPVSEIQPSTSRGSNERSLNFFNNSSNQTEEEEEEEIVTDPVSRHSRRNTLVLDNPEGENEQEQNDILDEDDEVTDHTYCQRLITINEEPEDFVSLNSTDRVKEIRIYLSPLPVEQTKDDNNSMTTFVGRSSSLSAEASNSILNSTLLNESNKSPDRMKFLNSMNISMPSPSNSRFECFDNKTIDGTNNASKETNQPSCSFMNNISSIMRCQSMQEDDSTVNNSSSDTEISKINAMKTLGLMEKTSELTTSTPVVQTQRTSRRLVKKSMDLSEAKSKMSPITSNITKRKVSCGTMLPQVIIKRLNLDQSGIDKDSLTNILDTTPMTSISDVKSKTRKRKATGTTSTLENDTQNEESVKRTVQTKGKENRKKILVVSTQTIKSSPRPKRAARPTVLRESSLKKKMRRSR